MSCEAKSEKLKACSKRVYESSVTSYEDEKFAPNFFSHVTFKSSHSDSKRQATG